MLKHKIMIQKKEVKLSSMTECDFGKINIVAGFPEKSILSYETVMFEKRADVVEKECHAIEKILKRALDDIEEIILKKEKKYAKH